MKKENNQSLKELFNSLLSTIYISCVNTYEANMIKKADYNVKNYFDYSKKINDLIRFNNKLIEDRKVMQDKDINSLLNRAGESLRKLANSNHNFEEQIIRIEEMFAKIYSILIEKGYEWKM